MSQVQGFPGYHDPTNPRLLAILGALVYRPVPLWLGHFEFKLFGTAYGRDYGPPPPEIAAEVTRLAALVPGQMWTTTFIQRYLPGVNVRSHRDPKNNVGYTVIGLYGDFTPTRLTVAGQEYEQHPGSAWVLPCTIAGVQGPLHRMEWPEGAKGIRYAIILNTIV